MMVGGNYPPGTSRRDLVRGGIIEPHSHDCEFYPENMEGPIIEDGAAIFHEQCSYVEGEYGQGYSCDNERSYRFEYDTLEVPVVDEQFKHIDLPEIGEWDDVEESISQVVIHIEEEFHCGNSDVKINVHPDPDSGEVTLEYCGFVLCFRP